MKLIRQRPLLVLACLALGSGSADAAGYSGPVRMLYPQADGSYVVVVNADPDLTACTGSVGYRYLTARVNQNSVSAEGLKNIVATLMLAFAADRVAGITYDDSSNNCYINRVSVGE